MFSITVNAPAGTQKDLKKLRKVIEKVMAETDLENTSAAGYSIDSSYSKRPVFGGRRGYVRGYQPAVEEE